MIEVRDIKKAFDSNEVLKGISTIFEKGKTNLIIGRSGSGKTVLLKSILGLFDIDSGEIWYDDRNFTETREKERKKMRQEMGMVFQGGALFDSISVEANVRFPLDMFTTMSAGEKQKRVDFFLDKVNK
jgi:phospholipid/cholesterol/gamma-HCH transport system ATP-binding protein